MPKKNRVALSDAERRELMDLVRAGTSSARKLTRVRILLKADENADAWHDQQIVAALDVGLRTVEQTRQRFAAGGVKAAVERRPQPPRPEKRKLDGVAEAQLTKLCCGVAPEGHERWSLHLLAEHMVKLEFVDSVSHETVRKALKKAPSSRG